MEPQIIVGFLVTRPTSSEASPLTAEVGAGLVGREWRMLW